VCVWRACVLDFFSPFSSIVETRVSYSNKPSHFCFLRTAIPEKETLQYSEFFGYQKYLQLKENNHVQKKPPAMKKMYIYETEWRKGITDITRAGKIQLQTKTKCSLSIAFR
jgi:hypothetical protein